MCIVIEKQCGKNGVSCSYAQCKSHGRRFEPVRLSCARTMNSLHVNAVGSIQSLQYCTSCKHEGCIARRIAAIIIGIKGFAYNVVVVTSVVLSEAVIACNNT